MPTALSLAAHARAHPPVGAVTSLTLIVLGAVLVGAVAIHALGFSVLGRVFGRPGRVFARSLVRNAKLPTSLIVPLAGLEIGIAFAGMPASLRTVLLHAVGTGIVCAVAFLVVRLTYVLEDMLLDRHRLDTADNLRARQLHTQVQILRRVTVVAASVLAVAVILLSFKEVRIAGASLLASAGVIGLVAGLAARPTVANVVAGLQIAFSQPIRVDDVVVVEEQWGRVEQIALTYVVVRLWDLRRLILPISYFIENPFENWTRSTADIVGWAYIEVDHSAPVEAMRDRMHEILAASPNWDGHIWNLQVSDAGPSSMQLRAVMSAPNSTARWDLQCEVREKLIAFLRDEHPGALPRIRTETAGERVGLGASL